MGRSSIADRGRGLLEGPIFKEVPKFLKNNRISLAYGLTSNTYETLTDRICFVFLFSCYIEENVELNATFGGFWGAWLHLPPPPSLGSAYEGHGSPSPVKTYMCRYTYKN